MTLRSKLLVAIVVVNVVVIGGLTTVIALLNERIGEDYRRALAASREAAKQEFRRAWESRAALWATQLNDPQLPLRAVLDPGITSFFEDGIIVNRWETIEGVTLDPNIFLNARGRRVREKDLSRDEVLRRVQLAIDDNEMKSYPDGWMAAPITYRDGDSSIVWGGVYARLVDPSAGLEEPETISAALSATIMGAGLLLLVLIWYVILSRVVVRRVDDLVAGSRRVARGEYGQPVPVPSGQDEMAALVRSFNAMAARVGDYHQHLEERVREATERAEAARRHLVIAQRLAATGTLVSGIAHEINNPLGGLINATRALQRREELDDSARRYLSLILDGLVRIGQTVRKILSFTPREVEPRAVSIRDVIERARDLVAHRLTAGGVEFRLEGPDATVMAAPGELQQVFLNLFLNSIKAMEVGGRLMVRVAVEGESVRIEVADSGCGMSPEQVERAFDLFFSTRDVGEGTGLGLSIAHHIISSHSGTVEIDSRPGAGTTIVVYLPCHLEEGGREAVADRTGPRAE